VFECRDFVGKMVQFEPPCQKRFSVGTAI
jgi:hypothetical protein